MEHDRALLDTIFAPAGFAAFRERAFRREVFRHSGDPARFAGLIGWSEVSALLETVPLAPPRIALARAGKAVPAAAFMREREGVQRIDGGALNRQLDDGATLIVNFLDEIVPVVGRLGDALADALDVRTTANLYASWRAENGLPLHWDHHGVLVLQIAGRKRWTIHAPTRPDPLQGDAFVAPPAGAAPLWEGMLEPGDLLYLPRGHPHIAAATDGPSLHLTFALIDATAHGYLRWLADELRGDPQWRAALPAPGGDDPALAEALRAGLGEVITAGSLARYRAARRAGKPARPRFAFPGLSRTPPARWTDATRLRLASQRSLDVTADGATGRVALGGTDWPCAAPVAAALAHLSGVHDTALGELERELDAPARAELRRLLTVLHMSGGLAAADPAA